MSLSEVLVRLHGVHGQGRQLAAQLRQLVVLERQAADLRGAHGREVRGVAEEDGPAVLLPLVEAGHGPMRRLGAEVRADAAQAERAVLGCGRMGSTLMGPLQK